MTFGVYRWENSDGLGPYNTRDDDGRYLKIFDHTNDGWHPSPFNAGETGGIQKGELCGFKNLQQMSNWFTVDEQNKMREYGFELVRIWVDSDYVRVGLSQVVFSRV
jgi:hypothetical protein